MADRLLPTWCSAAGLDEVELDQICDVFQDVLHHLPMPNVELARRIGVSQPAVSRWATGKNHASLSNMCQAIQVINAQMAETQARLYRAETLLCLAAEAEALHGMNGSGDPTKLAQVQSALRDALDRLPDDGEPVIVETTPADEVAA